MAQNRYFILDAICPGSEIPSMMCRVVTDKLFPLGSRFAPVEPLFGSNERRHNPQDIIPNILPAPIIIKDQKNFPEKSREKNLGVLGFEFSRSNCERLSIESQEMKRYQLNNPDHVFSQLMKNELYARDVRDLLSAMPSGRAYLVIGFVTSTGTIWKRTHVKSNAKAVEASMPVAFLSGLLGALATSRPKLKPSTTITVTRGDEMCIADEGIIAVSYCPVKTSYSLRKKGAQPTRKTPVLGPPKRAKAHHLALSGGESDEEVDESSDEEAEQRQDVVLSLQDEVDDDGIGSLDLDI
ncbi:hypothetical protein K440DRAFT_614473 [Wilcoxina mikolae CBS 423.85]|nr:hypothetical protein K440DRAFT_614473 [Wilcoxina mikolae CBS 423.85]